MEGAAGGLGTDCIAASDALPEYKACVSAPVASVRRRFPAAASRDRVSTLSIGADMASGGGKGTGDTAARESW